MQYCTHCGSPCSDAARFCAACGSRLAPPAATVDALTEGYERLAHGDTEEARRSLERALSETPDQPDVYLGLGVALLRQKEWAGAAGYLERAQALLPTDGVVHAYLGAARLGQFRVAEARALLDEALALAPQDFIVRLKRGEFFLRLGFYAEAVVELQAAVRLPVTEDASRDYARRLLVEARERAKQSITRRVALPRLTLPGWLTRE